MKPLKIVSAGMVVTALLVALSGCQNQEVPVEKAGKEVDKAIENVGDNIERAGDSIKEATTPGNK